MRTSGGRGSENSDTCAADKDGGGVKNGQKFADVLYGWPPMSILPDNLEILNSLSYGMVCLILVMLTDVATQI